MSDDAIKDALARIRDVAVLSREEVRELAVAIEVGVLADERLRIASASRAAVRDLIELRRRGRRTERRLVQHNLRLVVSVARRAAVRPAQIGDLIQAGSAGLVTAVRRFDWRLGFSFSTYATWWIRKSILTELANGRLIRLPLVPLRQALELARIERALVDATQRAPTSAQLSEASGIEPARVDSLRRAGSASLSLEQPLWSGTETTLADVLRGDDPEPADALRTQRLIERLTSGMSELDPEEALVVRMRYGFGDDRRRTVNDVAAALHVRMEHVVDLERAALGRLQRRLHHLV